MFFRRFLKVSEAWASDDTVVLGSGRCPLFKSVVVHLLISLYPYGIIGFFRIIFGIKRWIVNSGLGFGPLLSAIGWLIVLISMYLIEINGYFS